jgi:hypothetical protein
MYKDIQESFKIKCRPTEERCLKFNTELLAHVSYRETNWQTTNSVSQSIIIEELKNTIIKGKQNSK